MLDSKRALTIERNYLAGDLQKQLSINAELKEKIDKLKHELAYIKSSCLAAVLDAGDRYKRSILANVTQLDRSVLAMQYRDYYYMYCRIHNTDLQLNDQTMADVNLLMGSHFSIINPESKPGNG